MFNKESVDKILEGIVWLNTNMGIWSFILPVVFTIGVLFHIYRCYREPSEKNSRILMAVYAVIYIFSGYSIIYR